MNKYYTVTNSQFFVMSILVGIIASAIVIINSTVMDYLSLPVMTVTQDDQCVSVASYKNGEAYTCADRGGILRNYRVKR